MLWDLTRNAGWSVVPAGVAAVLVGAALGVLTYVLVMVLPRSGSNLTRVIGTLAVLIILESVVQLRYGTNALAVKAVPAERLGRPRGGIAIPRSRILLFGVAVVLALSLSAVYARTTFGLATTAVSERPRTLAALGWRIGMVGAINWGVGGALAGLAGVLLAPIIGVSMGNGNVLTVTVLAAALIGGLRSFSLTLVGGIVIGMLQSLFSIHDLGIPGLADAVPFVAIIGVIVIRGRSLPLRNFVGERLPRVGSGQIRIGAVIAAAGGDGRPGRLGLQRQRGRGTDHHAAHRDPVAVAHRAARVRGPDVAGPGHPLRGGRPDRGAAGGERRAAVPGRACRWPSSARCPSASSWGCRPPARAA